MAKVQMFPAPNGQRCIFLFFQLVKMTASLGKLGRDGQRHRPPLSLVDRCGGEYAGWEKAQHAKSTSITSKLAYRNQLWPFMACGHFQAGCFSHPGVHSYASVSALSRDRLNNTSAFEIALFTERSVVWMVWSCVYSYRLEWAAWNPLQINILCLSLQNYQSLGKPFRKETDYSLKHAA